ncbi:lytic transglycosylase domain-containing protein [Flavisphingomonas formosensis]|uniref:lytic transglycosylase domain-containing protein n=1 Tax=Flavisphingomonas formosensis TaxID=861534 RepID=UPI001E398437|nr:lytic transglycosylase domain-containing protein [Sphingomonas formosensis]
MTFARLSLGLVLLASAATPALAAGEATVADMLSPVTAPQLASAPRLALAATSASTALASRATMGGSALPQLLPPASRAEYRAVFAAIRAGNWSSAAARLDAMPDGLLTPVARAELYLAKGSPKTDLSALIALIAKAPELPEAAQLARLAKSRGATQDAIPTMPAERDLVSLERATRRQSAASIRSDAVAMALGTQIRPLILNDRPSDAEALLTAQQDQLCSEARTEWQQRVAWSYYLTGDDAAARRVAALAQKGAGEWTVQADWVAGLAAWRQKDFAAATAAFSSVASKARDSEMMAAGLFWTARAEMAGGHPERVQARLRSASRLHETFYGLLASTALGIAPPRPDLAPDFISADWNTISQRSNVRVAAALAEVGELGLADELLRHQARIGDTQDHIALLHLASKLNLPATQIWLAHNGPAGLKADAAIRYPAPGWSPPGGWRVDKALVFAHALQESSFRTDAVSGAGARGIMQLMPSTAQVIARKRGESMNGSQLSDPAFNIEYGQSYLEQLRDFSGTGGLLPKVIAAYNAGPGSVAKWNDRMRDRGDPLLYIESIPFAETRAYVAIVLRNYWMYERQSGVQASSLNALAQGMWPKFPGMPGRTALRLDPLSGVASAD